jgi:hypothetical protein
LSAADSLRRLVDALDLAEIDYMLGGSFASTYHGAPRTTHDVDVVAVLDRAALPRLLERFPDDAYYVSADAARDAVRRRGQFNVIDFASGWKADIIVRKDRAFSREELGRRVRANILGVDTWIASAEDVVISKLEWAKKGGGSERQLRDVRGVLDQRGPDLDAVYIARWVDALGLQAEWRSVRDDP